MRDPQSYPVRLLGWDTSARLGYLFAAEIESEGRAPVIRCAQVLDVDQKQHSEGLLLGISNALESCSWTSSQLSAIGIGVGPGSFTGIRIGLTTARTFGQIQGVPLVPVSSLEMLERAWRRSGDYAELPVIVCADACMGEVYCRMSLSGDDSRREVVTKIAGLKELLSQWLESSGEGGANGGVLHAILPDRWNEHPVLREIFSSVRWKVVQVSSLSRISDALSELVLREWDNGTVLPALEVHPVYLRVSDAELHLLARENALRNPAEGR